MTEKELKKLNRVELLEIMVAQAQEIERLRTQLDEANKALESRTIAINEAGSIANASLQLNGVFTAAEKAAAQYLENIKLLSGQQQEKCRQMEADCKAECETMRMQAQEYCEQEKQKADAYWKSLSARLQAFYDEHKGLGKMLARLEENEA